MKHLNTFCNLRILAILLCLLLSLPITAANMYWRKYAVDNNINNPANWVTNLADVEMQGDPSSIATSSPKRTDNVFFTVESNKTTLSSNLTVKDINCSAPVQYLLNTVNVYGSIDLNGNLVPATINMTGGADASINFNTDEEVGLIYNEAKDSWSRKFINFNINKSGARVDLLHDLNITAQIKISNIDEFYTNDYNMTALCLEDESYGNIDLGSSTITMKNTKFHALQYLFHITTANQPNCELIFELKQNKDAEYWALFPDGSNYKSITIVGNTGDMTPEFEGNCTLENFYIFDEATPNVSSYGDLNVNKFELNKSTNFRFNDFTRTLCVKEISSTANCNNPAMITGSGTIKLTGTDQSTENINYQNIYFDTSGANLIASETDNLGGNSGKVTWLPVTAKNFYWIGNSGNWEDVNNWQVDGSTPSCTPTAVDDVYFDNNSFTDVDAEVLLSADAACKNIYWNTTPQVGKLVSPSSKATYLSISGDANFSGASEVGISLYMLGGEDNSNYVNVSSNVLFSSQYIYFRHIGTYTITGNVDFRSTYIIHNSGTLSLPDSEIHVLNFESESNPAGSLRSLDLQNSEVNIYSTGSTLLIDKNGLSASNDLSTTHFISKNGAGMQFCNGDFVLDKVTFEKDGALTVGRYKSTEGAYTVDVKDLRFGANGSIEGSEVETPMTIDRLVLSPYMTYSFSTIAIGESLDARTGGCAYLYLTKGNIINSTLGSLSIPGAIISNVNYTQGGDGTDLLVPGGEDGGSNTNVSITSVSSRTLYWISGGNSNNWSDPTNWTLNSDGTPNNPDGCIPRKQDDVYFNGYSFTDEGQEVLVDISPIYINSMYWTSEAGVKKPVLNNIDSYSIYLDGSMILANGMSIVSNSASNNFYFTGNYTDVNSQVIDMNEVIPYKININITGTGRFDLKHDFIGVPGTNASSFIFSGDGSLYTNNYDINPGNYIRITKNTSNTINLGSSTITGLQQNTGRLSITNCENFVSENAIIEGGLNASGSTCPLTFKEIYNDITANPNYLITADKIAKSSSYSGLSLIGTFETDILEIGTGLTLNGTVTVNDQMASPINATPCVYGVIQGKSASEPAILKFNYCNPELYLARLSYVEAQTLAASACAGKEQTLTVYGAEGAAGSNTGVTFKQAPLTGDIIVSTLVVCDFPIILEYVDEAYGAESYRWTKDGIDIPAADGGKDRTLTISEGGVYEQYVDYGRICNARFTQTVSNVANLTWIAEGRVNDWEDKANWDAGEIPQKCSYVIIPGNLPHYPILNEPDVDNYMGAKCATIEFLFGGEVKNTHWLDYDDAIVDLTVNGNQWYMLSAPLHNTYTGDVYATEPNPFQDGLLMEMMYFNEDNPENGKRYGNWSGRFNNADIEYLPGQGFALWVNDMDAEYDEQIPVTMRFPKKDENYKYYNKNTGKPTGDATGTLDRTNTGRFIYEGTIDESGNVVLSTSEASADGDLVFVGNPFMAHLDFDKFATRNTSEIYDEYKLAYGLSTADGVMNDFSTYKKIGGTYFTNDPVDASLSGLIAPMQSFIVVSRKADPTIVANATETVAATAGSLPTLRSTDNNMYPVALEISAQKAGEFSKTLLLHFAGASNSYRPEEDSYKVFSPYAKSPLVVYTRSTDGIALDINSIESFDSPVALCFATTQTGEITFTFDGFEEFAEYADVYLHDTYAEALINLTERIEYRFTKTGSEQFVEDRFSLLFVPKTVNMDKVAFGDVKVFNEASGMVQVVSANDIQSVQVFDMQGRTINAMPQVNDKVCSFSLNKQGVYLVQVISGNKRSTHKVIVK